MTFFRHKKIPSPFSGERTIFIVLPPFFADGSHRLPHQVRLLRRLQSTRPRDTPARYRVPPLQPTPFRVGYRTPGCIQISFSRASHQPAAFCGSVLSPTSSHHSFWKMIHFSKTVITVTHPLSLVKPQFQVYNKRVSGSGRSMAHQRMQPYRRCPVSHLIIPRTRGGRRHTKAFYM